MVVRARSFELREFFHLVFLRHLALRLLSRPYAVKGGICLRFFHRSLRLSEDMDLDIASRIPVKTVQNAVDSILRSRSFLGALAPAGVASVNFSKPKQTETVQRWKASLQISGNVFLPTKIEFSRRHGQVTCETGRPEPEILEAYKLPPFAAQYYGKTAMCAQKILALASPSRNAVRDLFDLHHLFQTSRVNMGEVKKKVDHKPVEQAAEKIKVFSHKDFKEEVLPYLASDLMALYDKPPAFAQLKEEVEGKLIELLP